MRRFWASYVASRDRYDHLDDETAWDLVIPFRAAETFELARPPQRAMTGSAEVFLYPSAITVIARLNASGSWPLTDLCSFVDECREATDWRAAVDGRLLWQRRSLDGIADELAGRYASKLLPGRPSGQLSAGTVTVATPMAGTGKLGDFDVTRTDVQQCLAALAALRSTNQFDPKGLLSENRPWHAARVYVQNSGHVIWHPEAMLANRRRQEGLHCLHANHSDLAAHIASLSTAVSWAAGRIKSRTPIPVAAQPYLQRTALRLQQLSDGDTATTYRSLVAQRRVADHRANLTAVQQYL